MFRIFSVVLFLLSAAYLRALETGDDALELKTKFYNGKVFKARFYMVDAKNRKKLKVLVFARLLSEDFKRSEYLLVDVAGRPGVSVGVAGCSENEVMTFAKSRPDFKFPLLFDRNAHDKYMERNIIYPRAYVIDYQNRIIWDGELLDLPAMLDQFAAGKYDFEKNRKINHLLNEMQNALRNGSEYQLDRAAREIMAIDPGNLSCLRLRMFSFENTNRLDEAWAFLEEFKKINPGEKHFYLLQIDMAARHAAFSKAGSAVGMEFLRRKMGTPEEQLLAAWLFVTRYNFNSEALECCAGLLDLIGDDFGKGEKLTPILMQQQSLYCNARAMLCYKYADLENAAKYQRRAYEVLKNENNLQILKYYEKIMKKK